MNSYRLHISYKPVVNTTSSSLRSAIETEYVFETNDMITLSFKVLRLVGNYYVLCSVSSVYLYGWSPVNLNFNGNTLNRGLEFYKDLVQPFQMFALGRVNISLFEQLVSLVSLVTYIFGLTKI